MARPSRHALLVAPWLIACTSGPDADRRVNLSLGDPIAELDPRFLSFAVDLGQVAGTRFWNPDADADDTEVPVPPFPFEDPRLRARTAPLAPAWLRLGGTEADRLFYEGDDPVDAPPAGYEAVLPRARWDAAVAFAADLDLRLLVTLNGGPGPRIDGVWQPEHAAGLIRHAVAQGAPVGAWEHGNEPNAWPLFFGQSVPPAAYADELGALRALLDELGSDAQIAGPATAYWPAQGEFIPYLPDVLAADVDPDIVTWHYYPQQGRRCPLQTTPAGPEVLLDPAALDLAGAWAAEVAAATEDGAPAAARWLGETGNAQCGGEPGVSDRWAGTLWWADQLGLMAATGHEVVVRQALAGADYGLLDDAFAPRPDWWLSVLHKRLMGPTVLAATSDDPRVRVYAHSGPEGVVVMVINLYPALSVGLDLRGAAWILDAADLTSDTVRLHGAPLALDGDDLPELDPQLVDGLVVPPLGVALLSLEGGGYGGF